MWNFSLDALLKISSWHIRNTRNLKKPWRLSLSSGKKSLIQSQWTYQESEEELEEHLDDGRRVWERLGAHDEGCQEEGAHEPLAVLGAGGRHNEEQGAADRVAAVEHPLVTGDCGDVIHYGGQVVVADLVKAATPLL